MAAAVCANISGPSATVLNLNQGGTVNLVEGSPDLAGSRTAVAMHVAELLGIQITDAHPSIGDTDSIGFTAFTAGSSATYKTGWACYETAHDLLRQLKQRAALIWGVPEDDVEWSESQVFHSSDPELRLTIKELAGRTGGGSCGR